MGEYIELHRTFHQLFPNYDYAGKWHDGDVIETFDFQGSDGLHMETLLQRYRVILLAEAGAGKTCEIRQATKKLRAKGRYAFFLRLEHIVSDLEMAFEEGTYQEFQDWKDSTKEGWLFLDSVDEARLKNPKDFEKAIKKLKVKISLVLPRTHIIITSRGAAWRYDDLAKCNEYFSLPLEEEETGDKNDSSNYKVDKKPAQGIKAYIAPAEKFATYIQTPL